MPPWKYTAENNRIARARFAKESRNPARDIARKAKMAKSIDDYDPRRNDWKGVDTPGSKKPRKASRKRRSAPKEKPFSAAEAWRAHVLATHKQMGGSLKDAMRAASKTWIKKGNDPFTNFMAASDGGVPAPVSVPLPVVSAKPAVDTSYVKELNDLEAIYAPKPLDTSYVSELNDLEAMYPAPKPVISVPLPPVQATSAPAAESPPQSLFSAVTSFFSPKPKQVAISKEVLYNIMIGEVENQLGEQAIMQYLTNGDMTFDEERSEVIDSDGFIKFHQTINNSGFTDIGALKEALKSSEYYKGTVEHIALNAEVESDDEDYELAPEPEAEPEPIPEPVAEAVVEPPAPVAPPVSVPLPQIAQDDNDALDANTFAGWQKITMGISDDAYVEACRDSKIRTVAQLKDIVEAHYTAEDLIADYPPIGLPATKTKKALLGKLNKSHLCVFLAKIGGNAREFGVSKEINKKTALKKNP